MWKCAFYFLLSNLFGGLCLQDKNKCKCHTLTRSIRCNSGSSDADLKIQCASDCGEEATMIIFISGSKCMADGLQKFCPNITEVKIDDESQCVCYCPVPNININGSTMAIDCKCNETISSTLRPTTNIPEHAANKSLIIVLGTVGSFVFVGILLTTAVIMRRRFNRGANVICCTNNYQLQLINEEDDLQNTSG